MKQARTWARDQETLQARGTLVEGKFTIGVLLDDLKDYYQQQHKGWWAPMLIDVHLKPFFGTLPADQITTAELNRYIRQRQAKVKDTTIGNELAVLHRAFSLGMKHDPPKVHRIPHIPRFKPSEPRQGIFEDHEYCALLRELPEEIKPILIYAYFTGSRKGETLGLPWSEVDLDAALARLPGPKTKNKKPRTIPLAPDVVEALRMQKAVRDRYWPTCRFVFFRHGTGTQVKDFRTAWELACKRAGLWNEETQKPTRLVHDLRRTAVSNPVDSGVRIRIFSYQSSVQFSEYLTASVTSR